MLIELLEGLKGDAGSPSGQIPRTQIDKAHLSPS